MTESKDDVARVDEANGNESVKNEEQNLEEHIDETEENGDEAMEDGQGEEPAFSLEELFARHGGDPKKLDLSRSVLVSNLPSDLLGDDYEVFNDTLMEMISSDFKVPREHIDAVIRVPKLQADSADQENALCALISFKSKVHKHRMIAQKKVDDKSSLNLSTLEEIPKEWFDVDLFALADEIGEGEEEHEKADEDKKKECDEKEGKKKEKTKEEIEAEKLRDKEEREAFIKRYVEDNEDDIAFTTDWDGAPEFQWKICTGKNDHKKVILDNVSFCDMRDPFLYRAVVKAENAEFEFPGRYNSDGTKTHKGKMTLTFSRDHYVMPVAMRSLIYIRCQNKRRIKIYLPQQPSTLKLKDEFEKRLGRVIEQTEIMRQLVVKVLPADFVPTVEKAIEWFPGCNIDNVEAKEDGRGQRVAVVTFSALRDTMDAHSSTAFVTIDDKKCNVFLMSIEVNKFLLSAFDKQEEKDIFREKIQKKNEEERAERATKRKAEVNSVSEKKGRWEAPASRGSGSRGRGGSASVRGRGGTYISSTRGRGSIVPRGSRGGYRGSSRGAAVSTPSARTVGRGPVGSGRYDGPAPFESSYHKRREDPIREQLYRQQQMLDTLSDRLRDPPLSRSAFDLSSRPFGSSSAFSSGSSYGGSSAFSSSAFGASYPSERHSSGGGYSSSSFGGSRGGSGDYYSPEKRRSYGY